MLLKQCLLPCSPDGTDRPWKNRHSKSKGKLQRNSFRSFVDLWLPFIFLCIYWLSWTSKHHDLALHDTTMIQLVESDVEKSRRGKTMPTVQDIPWTSVLKVKIFLTFQTVDRRFTCPSLTWWISNEFPPWWKYTEMMWVLGQNPTGFSLLLQPCNTERIVNSLDMEAFRCHVTVVLRIVEVLFGIVHLAERAPRCISALGICHCPLMPHQEKTQMTCNNFQCLVSFFMHRRSIFFGHKANMHSVCFQVESRVTVK